MALILRFQNVPEEEHENLRLLLSEALAPLVDIEPETLQNEIDLVYRVTSSYAREIHIRFCKRSVRDRILRETRDENLVIKANGIRILKDIPWSTRKKRKQYECITTILRENEISYRWLIIES